jgi:hypothetical protein
VTLLQSARESAVPKLTVATGSLKEQLSAYGVKALLSEGCLKDFVRNAIDALVRTQQQGGGAHAEQGQREDPI